MNLPKRLSHPPTREDVDALPDGVKGEVIDGVLYAMTRPRPMHQRLAGHIHADLFSPFDRGRGGPGGWWLLVEPGIELPRSPEIAPDVGGWRRERLPNLPSEAIRVVPDWVCEILSPTTRRHDVLVKIPYYASIGVAHLWLVDLDARTLHAHRLSEEGLWLSLGTYGDELGARVPPFDSVPLNLTEWWQGIGSTATDATAIRYERRRDEP